MTLLDIYEKYDRFFAADDGCRILIDKEDIFPDDYYQYVRERQLTESIFQKIAVSEVIDGRIPEAKCNLSSFLSLHNDMFEDMYNAVGDGNPRSIQKSAMYLLALINGCAKDELYDILERSL